MKNYELIITPDAEADLYAIRDYIAYALCVPDVALDYMRTLRKEMSKLAYMATMFAPIEFEPYRSKGVRKITVKNFYIYYLPDDVYEKVYILNVIYTKRDQLKALKNMNIND